MVVFCGALVGAGLGFLWFNTYPAQVFMGDVGALALGAALGTLAVIVRQELVLFYHGRHLRSGDGFGDAASRIVQINRAPNISHGAIASSLRAQGLARASHYRALLDYYRGAGANWPCEFKDTVMLSVNQQKTALRDINYLIVGLGVTGYSVARYLLGHGYRCRIQDTRELPPFLGQLNAEFDEIDFRAQPLDIDLIGLGRCARGQSRDIDSAGCNPAGPRSRQARARRYRVVCRFGRQARYRDHRFQWQEHGYNPGRRNDQARR